MKGREMTKEINKRMFAICLFAALAFSWLSGFCGGVLVGMRVDADQPTAREQQIERYEEMGR